MKATINGIEVEGDPRELVTFMREMEAEKEAKPKKAEKVKIAKKSKNYRTANAEVPKWTEAEKRQLWSMAVKGVPMNLIAEKIGRTEKACTLRLWLIRKSPDTKKQLSGERKVSKKRYPSRFKKWTSAEKEFVKKEAANGSNNASIARQLGRKRASVAVQKSLLNTTQKANEASETQ